MSLAPGGGWVRHVENIEGDTNRSGFDIATPNPEDRSCQGARTKFLPTLVWDHVCPWRSHWDAAGQRENRTVSEARWFFHITLISVVSRWAFFRDPERCLTVLSPDSSFTNLPLSCVSRLSVSQTNYTATFVENSKLKRLLLKAEKDLERIQSARDRRLKSVAKAVRAVRVRHGAGFTSEIPDRRFSVPDTILSSLPGLNIRVLREASCFLNPCIALDLIDGTACCPFVVHVPSLLRPPPPAAGVCVWLHGGAHVGTAVDIFLAGLPVAFVVFACPVGWQGGWQRGGTVHCGDVFVRVGTTVVAVGMMTALLDHPAQQILVLLILFPCFFPLKL